MLKKHFTPFVANIYVGRTKKQILYILTTLLWYDMFEPNRRVNKLLSALSVRCGWFLIRDQNSLKADLRKHRCALISCCVSLQPQDLFIHSTNVCSSSVVTIILWYALLIMNEIGPHMQLNIQFYGFSIKGRRDRQTYKWNKYASFYIIVYRHTVSKEVLKVPNVYKIIFCILYLLMFSFLIQLFFVYLPFAELIQGRFCAFSSTVRKSNSPTTKMGLI